MSGIKKCIQVLRQNNTIRQFIALLLLLLAVFGSTPKKYLHDAVANHEDSDFGFRNKKATISTSAYNCGFDHQVAESPYVETPVPQLPAVTVVYANALHLPLYTAPVFGFRHLVAGRGPPATSAS